MKKIVFGVYIFFSMIISIFYMLVLKVLKKEDRFYDLFLKPCFTLLLKILNVDVNVEGKINYPLNNTLVIANHLSLMDIVVLFVHVNEPMVFVSKIENSKIPIIGSWMKYQGSIFIDRSKVKESIRSLSKATNYMKNNKPVMIFPQGTREDNDINFKPGSLKFVQKSKGDILTIALTNTNKILKGFSYRKIKVDFYVRDILKYEEYENENLVLVQKQLETWVKEKVL